MLLLCFCCLPMNTSARRETAPFRLTGSDAFLKLRTEFFETRIKTKDTEAVVQSPHFYNEFGVSTLGFIYHPRLLQFNISGGMTMDRLESDSEIRTAGGSVDTSSRSTTKALWDLNARFNFLQRKPYPLTLFYARHNPLVSTGLEGDFVQEDERYGFNFSLSKVVPMRLFLNGQRRTSTGESLNRIIDDTTDRISMRLFQNFGSVSEVAIDYELTHQLSRSGDPEREVLETETLAHLARLNSTWRFGGHDQFYLNETASFDWRNNPEVIAVRAAPILRWALTDTLISLFSYNYDWNKRVDDDLQSERHGAAIRLRYQPDTNLFLNAGLRGDKSNESEGLKQKSYSGLISANYTQGLPWGSMNVIPSLEYTFTARDASAVQISVKDESLQLSGVTLVALAREFVVPGTVVVRNTTRTQTFIEGVDYRLVEVGTQTEIQRLTTGDILEGERVIVDYEVLSGGKLDYSSLASSLNVNMNLARYYLLFVRYRGRDQKVESGNSTLPLNSIHAVEVGGRADVPLRWYGILVGGEAKYLYQEENINPFNETSVTAYVQLPLPKRVNLRLTAQHTIRENSDSKDETTALLGNLSWRARRNLNVSANGRYERGSGRGLERTRTDSRLRATWSYRKLYVSVEAQYQQESQGSADSSLLRGWLVIKRDLW